MNRILELLGKISAISAWKFIRYNYFTKGVKRKRGTFIFPTKNTFLEIQKGAELILEDTLKMGISAPKKSKEETLVRLQKDARWIVHGEVGLWFNVFIDVHPYAILETGSFTANARSVIVAGKRIEFGNNVMIGRDVTIYDSDFHQILNEDGKPTNFSREVKVGNNVWLTNKIMVLKGVAIGDGSIVSAMTLVREDVPAHSLVAGNPGRVIKDCIHWSRDSICDYENLIYQEE